MIDKGQKQTKSLVRFYQPYSRLYFRAKIEDTLLSNPKVKAIAQGMDIVSAIDAVLKRGGCDSALRRIQQIQLSLPYYDSNVVRKSCQNVKLIESEVLKYFEVPYPSQQKFIEQHLLPSTNGLYNFELSHDQSIFAKQNFTNFDEYLTIKTLSYFGADLTKLDLRYAQKYFKLRKWLYIHDLLVTVPEWQMQFLKNIHLTNPAKICIIGITLCNIILAIKLANLGFVAKIYDNSQQDVKKWASGEIISILKQGIFVNNEVEKNKLNQILSTHFNLEVQQFNILDAYLSEKEDNNRYNQFNEMNQNFYKHQKIFIILLDEMLGEYHQNSKKNAWQQIQQKAIISNNNYENRSKSQKIFEKINIEILKVHYERFIMMSKIKQLLNATVNDIMKSVGNYYTLANYPVGFYNKINYRSSKIKMALNSSPFYVSSKLQCKQKFQQLLIKSHENMNISLDKAFIKLQHSQKFETSLRRWLLYTKNISNGNQQTEQFDFVIYSDERSIERALLQSNYSIAEVEGCNFNEGLPLLQQISIFGEIHCLYKFIQKVAFKELIYSRNQNFNNYFYHVTNFGIVHFYLFGSGTEVLATVCKTHLNENLDLYRQIQNILLHHVLKRSYKLQIDTPILKQTQLLFSLKEEKLIQNFIKMRDQQRFYISLPLIYGESPRNSIQCQMKINNKIMSEILHKLTIKEDTQQKNERVGILLKQYYNFMKIDINKCVKIYLNNQQSLKKPNQKQTRQQKKKNKEITQQVSNVSIQSQAQKSQKNKIIKQQIKEKEKLKQNKADILGIESPLAIQYWNIATNQVHQISKTLQKYGLNTQITQQVLAYSEIDLTNLTPINGINQQCKIYIYQLGFPYLPSKVNNTNMTLQNFISVREGRSLLHQNRWAIFYQMCIIVQSLPFYCIIEQTRQGLPIQTQPNSNKISIMNMSLMIFHTNLQTLTKVMKDLHKQIDRTSIMQIQGRNLIHRMGFNSQICTIPALIKHLIRVQINNYSELYPMDSQSEKANNYENICNLIMNAKIKTIQNHHIHHNKLGTTLASLLTDLSTIPINYIIKYLYQDAQNYLSFLTSLYKLKPYSLADIMFGKLNAHYILKQIQGYFTNYHSLQLNEQTLQFENAEDIGMQEANKNIIIDFLKQLQHGSKYELKIQRIEQGSKYKLQRKFLYITREQCQQLAYHTLVVSHDSMNVQPNGSYSDAYKWLALIISNSVINGPHMLHIMQKKLKDIIREELKTAIKIINLHNSQISAYRTLFNYFALTRMNLAFQIKHQTIYQTTIANIKQFTPVLQKDNSQSNSTQYSEWWAKTEQMVNESEFVFLNQNQFIFCNK